MFLDNLRKKITVKKFLKTCINLIKKYFGHFFEKFILTNFVFVLEILNFRSVFIQKLIRLFNYQAIILTKFRNFSSKRKQLLLLNINLRLFK
jgi:hypothetical protein